MRALVAELTGAEFVSIPGGGHNPLGRFPAKSNALIDDFLDRQRLIEIDQDNALNFLEAVDRLAIDRVAAGSTQPKHALRDFLRLHQSLLRVACGQRLVRIDKLAVLREHAVALVVGVLFGSSQAVTLILDFLLVGS